MRKSKLIKTLLVILASMTVLLIGCGGDDADDPNLGVYKAKSAEMAGFKVGVEEVFEDGFIIELKSKGKAHLEADGEDGGTIKWTLDGDKFHAEGGGAVLDGTLSDGVMVLENVMDSGMTLYLECDEIIANTGKEDDAKVTSKGKKDTSEEETGDPDSLYGRYEAVSATDSDGEVWIEEGEYLTVNDDDTVSMYVAEQNLDFDTTIKNNKFYLDGDTKVGEINDDGSITLSLSDEVKYTFAKKGSDLWKEWRSVMGEEGGSLGVGDFGAVDITGGSDEGTVNVDYDFDEALKLVGDYEGFIIFKEGAHCYGRSFDGITGDAYARVVIDKNKQPLVYMRHIYGESINIEHVDGKFDDDGWLRITGVMGTDDGPTEWVGTIRPPVGNEPMCVTGVLTSDYETPLFEFYMKPLGSKWDYSYLDEVITKKDFDAYVNNMAASDTGLLEDDLELMQDFWSKNAKKDDPIKMITDELPDPELLHLYK
ncbi:MAG: hypothetical protein K6G42_01000 [Lachnospiraceae bacterium]|nr:hypothetical protein [Lachnospiraceae bacterium]